MTLDEFIEKLAATKEKGWELRSGAIRTRLECRCPIIAVHGDYGYVNCLYPSAASAMGLSVRDAEDVAVAADVVRPRTEHIAAIRTRLLAAVGLEP